MALSPAPAKVIRSVDAPAPPTGGAGLGTQNARHRTDRADHIVPTDIVGLGRPTRDSTWPPTSKDTQGNISSRTATCVDAPSHHESAHPWGHPAALRFKRRNALLPRTVNEGTDQRDHAGSPATPPDSSPPAEPITPDRLLHRPSPNCRHKSALVTRPMPAQPVTETSSARPHRRATMQMQTQSVAGASSLCFRPFRNSRPRQNRPPTRANAKQELDRPSGPKGNRGKAHRMHHDQCS
jgi:hypothetical protein